MRIINGIIGSLTLTFTLAASLQAQAPFTNGLVAYYPFDGDANDATEYNNNPTRNTATLSTNRFWDASSAYDFGSGKDVRYNHAPQLSFGPDTSLAVFAWIKFKNSPAGFVGILSKSYFDSDPDRRGFQLGINNNRLWVETRYDAVDVHGNGVTVLNDGKWHAVGFVLARTNSVVQLFVDGKPDGAIAGSGQLRDLSNTNALLIGVERNLWTFFDGSIDDVRIYNRALSSSEAEQLYAYESSEVSQPCIPHAATAVPTVVNGFVVELQVTAGGCGYTNAPLVKIAGGGGSGATAVATISNGVVTALTVTSAGFGYTSTPIVKIASPPFTPWLEIAVSKVKVTQHLVLGRNYIFESSKDMSSWIQIGPQFKAEEEIISQELDVTDAGRFFRVREVQ